MATKQKAKALDLGTLQDNMEQAARNYKAANTLFLKAKDALEKAESEYTNAKAAVNAGVEQLKAATKI